MKIFSHLLNEWTIGHVCTWESSSIVTSWSSLEQSSSRHILTIGRWYSAVSVFTNADWTWLSFPLTSLVTLPSGHWQRLTPSLEGGRYSLTPPLPTQFCCPLDLSPLFPQESVFLCKDPWGQSDQFPLHNKMVWCELFIVLWILWHWAKWTAIHDCLSLG
jgi:hypothetical protein